MARMMATEPRLIAAGRASEVYDLGDGRVLRRFKRGGYPEREAAVMRHARLHGYPAPEVFEIRPDALVLEKVPGPTMWQAVTRQPGKVKVHAALLAQLHRDLHKIGAPQGLPAVGSGDRLLHLDLHPANVILTTGPVVIDWTNARRGTPAFDAALTWIICASSTGVGRLGRSFLHPFLSHFDRNELRRILPTAAQYRLKDENIVEEERQAIRALVDQEHV